jgi:hypothetical protein
MTAMNVAAASHAAERRALQSLALPTEGVGPEGERFVSKSVPALSQAWSERWLTTCYQAFCCLLREAAEIYGPGEFEREAGSDAGLPLR